MKKSVKIILVVVFSVILTGSSRGDSFARENTAKILLLEEFIRKASANDTGFEKILIDELKLKYKKALELPAGDFILSIKQQYDFFYDPDDDGNESSVSLSRLFPYTGTTITAEYSSSVNSSTRKVSSDFTAYISQPIARNAFGRNTRILDRIVGLETEVAYFQIIEAYEDYLASLIQLYYNWYSAYENLNTARNSYKENVKLLENIKEREKYKIALPVDVNKISLQVAAKEESLVSLENKYDEYLALVKESIRCGAEELVPAKPSIYDGVLVDFSKDYEMFADKSRTTKILNMLEDKAAFAVDKYADELLPSIDIIAGYSLEGSGHEVKDPGRMAYAGVSLEWPLPGQVERARHDTARIDLKKTRISSEDIHRRLHAELKNLNDRITAEGSLITLAAEKIDYARSIVDDDRKNYSLGRVSLNDLIDEVNKLEDNKFNKIYHEIERKRLIVEWLRLTDRLVKAGGISWME